jgi:hypothetical protein
MIRPRHLLVLSTFLLSVLLYVDRVCNSAAKGASGRGRQSRESHRNRKQSRVASTGVAQSVEAGFVRPRFSPLLPKSYDFGSTTHLTL